MGPYKTILQLKIMGLSDDEIARVIEPRNIVFSVDEMNKALDIVPRAPVIMWDDIGYWLTPWLPRPSKFALFWEGIESE